MCFPFEVSIACRKFEEHTQNNVRLFLHRIFQELPRESTEDGVLGVLDQLHEAKVKLPRSLSVPVSRPMTKWEQFAKANRIQKTNKSKMVYDKVDKNWKIRYGGRSLKHAEDKREIAIEHKAGSNYMQDPFAEKAALKVAKRAKQNLAEIKNKVHAAGYRLPRGKK